MPALGLNVLPLAVARFRQKYQNVTFDIQTRHYDSLVQSLLESENDIGLAFNPPDDLGLERHFFGDGEIVCVFGENSFEGRPTPLRLEDLAGRDLISIEDSGPLSDILDERLKQADVELSSVISVQTYYIAKALVGYGAGVAIVDQLTAMFKGAGQTQFCGFSPPINFTVQALYNEIHPLSKVCKRFLEFFRKVYDEYVYGADSS